MFATLRERAHAAELTREFPEGATVGEIWRQMVVEFPELGGHHDSVGFAVNQEYVEGAFKPRMGEERAVTPPGGRSCPPPRRAQSCRPPPRLAATTRAGASFAWSRKPTSRWRYPKCAS